jgi:hypothetical protein
MTVLAAQLQALPLVVFAAILAVTLGITYWASKLNRLQDVPTVAAHLGSILWAP